MLINIHEMFHGSSIFTFYLSYAPHKLGYRQSDGKTICNAVSKPVCSLISVHCVSLNQCDSIKPRLLMIFLVILTHDYVHGCKLNFF